MNGPSARILPDGCRLHLQHGPSDLIILAEGERDRAFDAAIVRFQTIIEEVVEELDQLREMVSPISRMPRGAVAQRMHGAVLPFAGSNYVTRMAAVAGAIADEVLDAMKSAANLTRAYVNNGGDIALHLAEGESFSTVMMGYDGQRHGTIKIEASDPVRGIATSGRHGRSQSLGIADSVTTLAKSAAQADVAATLVANAVDLPAHPAITRRPAREIVEDSDLGTLPVVTGCGHLAQHEVSRALSSGLQLAEDYRADGVLFGAGLFLQGHSMTTHATRFLETAYSETLDV